MTAENRTSGSSSPWYRTLNREQWRVLFASNLGWLFDGFEIYALFLTVGFALHQLLEAAQYSRRSRAMPAMSWQRPCSAGRLAGSIGGIIADYIGRKRTMMPAILAYSLTTGLSAVAWNWESFAILRFLVGVGSARNGRPVLRSSPNCGPITRAARAAACCRSRRRHRQLPRLGASGWRSAGWGPNAWRFMYLVGVLPALLVLWIWRNMPNRRAGKQANERRRAAHAHAAAAVPCWPAYMRADPLHGRRFVHSTASFAAG